MVVIISFLSHFHTQIHSVPITQIRQLTSPLQYNHNFPDRVVALFIWLCVPFQHFELQFSIESLEPSSALENHFHLVVIFELWFVDIAYFDDDFVGNVKNFGQAFGVFELDLIFVFFCVFKKLQKPFIFSLNFHFKFRRSVSMSKY